MMKNMPENFLGNKVSTYYVLHKLYWVKKYGVKTIGSKTDPKQGQAEQPEHVGKSLKKFLTTTHSSLYGTTRHG